MGSIFSFKFFIVISQKFFKFNINNITAREAEREAHGVLASLVEREFEQSGKTLLVVSYISIVAVCSEHDTQTLARGSHVDKQDTVSATERAAPARALVALEESLLQLGRIYGGVPLVHDLLESLRRVLHAVRVEHHQSVKPCIFSLAPCGLHRLAEYDALRGFYVAYLKEEGRKLLLQPRFLLMKPLAVGGGLGLVHLFLDAADFVDGFLHVGIIDYLEEVFSGCR